MIICPRCARPLPDWLFRESYTVSICPACQSALEFHAFPALYRSPEKLDLAQLESIGGEAGCCEHPSKRASALCANCGRFLCSLCEVPLGGEILCPDCVHNPKAKSRQDSLDTERTLYDSIALTLATWPLLLFYFTVITAPLSIGIAIYGWQRPGSIVRRSRWRLYAAVILSSLEIAGMTVLIIFLIYSARRRLG